MSAIPGRLRTVTCGRTTPGLHCEVPGAVINIMTDLHDADGRPVVQVEILPDNHPNLGHWEILDGAPTTIRIRLKDATR